MLNKKSLGVRVLRITKLRSDDRVRLSQHELTFERYAKCILSGDIKSAGEVLAHLFKVSPQRALRCALYYADLYMTEPMTMETLMQSRYYISQKDYKSARKVLSACFGLDIFESTYVLRNLTNSVSA